MNLVGPSFGDMIMTPSPTPFQCQEPLKYSFQGMIPIKLASTFSTSTWRCYVKRSTKTCLFTTFKGTYCNENFVKAIVHLLIRPWIIGFDNIYLITCMSKITKTLNGIK